MIQKARALVSPVPGAATSPVWLSPVEVSVSSGVPVEGFPFSPDGLDGVSAEGYPFSSDGSSVVPVAGISTASFA